MIKSKLKNKLFHAAMFVVCVSFVIVIQTNSARAEMCLISDKSDTSLNVRDAPNGKIVNRLLNGRKVFLTDRNWDGKGRIWRLAEGEYKGKWRKWGWVFGPGLDCNENVGTDKYPIVFDGAAGLTKFGFALYGYERDGRKEITLPYQCYYYGDGGYSLSMKKSVMADFKKRGFSEEKVCLLLRVEKLRFHPENGQRLPTYVVANLEKLKESYSLGYAEAGVTAEELMLVVPNCYRKGSFSAYGPVIMSMTLGCKMNFDPWTGIKLSKIEQRFYKKNVKLWIDGAAGPSGELASKELLVSAKNRVTQADIQAVLNARKESENSNN
ncbi:MAG: hypothetical protein ACR2O3_07395 [Rhizobiaceae bacterium]